MNVIKKLQNPHLYGIAWFMASLLISNLNDIITKQMAIEMPYQLVAFFRFAFGAVALLPFMLWNWRQAFFTQNIRIHFIRGIILFVALNIWSMGLTIIPLVSATLLTFTIPFFILILARIFLQEKVNSSLWMATILGLLGAIVLLNPTQASFNNAAWLMMFAAFLFASLDIINKSYINRESTLGMLFYSAFVTTILGLYPAYIHWQYVPMHDLLKLFILGANSNLILFCLLRAFKYVNASSVAPYRYLEILLSALLGIIIFGEVLYANILAGALLIIAATLIVTYEQTKKHAKGFAKNPLQHSVN